MLEVDAAPVEIHSECELSYTYQHIWNLPGDHLEVYENLSYATALSLKNTIAITFESL